METKGLLITEVEFVEGCDAVVESGIKKHHRTRGVVVSGGNGTYITVVPNKIIVHGVTVTGEEVEINVLQDLRDGMGLKRLHQSHRAALITNHPEKVYILKTAGGFWALRPESVEVWLSKAGIKSGYKTPTHYTERFPLPL